MRTRCPHCMCVAMAVKSEQLTRLYREAVYRCDSAECGCTFKVSITPICVISPSSLPHPDVDLPLSPRSPHRKHEEQGELSLDEPNTPSTTPLQGSSACL